MVSKLMNDEGLYSYLFDKYDGLSVHEINEIVDLVFGQQRLYADEIISADEYRYNEGPTSIDLQLSPEMEADHNKRVLARNQLRAEMRTRNKGDE